MCRPKVSEPREPCPFRAPIGREPWRFTVTHGYVSEPLTWRLAGRDGAADDLPSWCSGDRLHHRDELAGSVPAGLRSRAGVVRAGA
jgi:hypothetical protein